MGRVNYEYFDTEKDYSKNPNVAKHSSFNVSQYNFSKYAILNGIYTRYTMSYDAKGFYSSICKMAVKKEKNFFVVTDDYKLAENSYKTVISFAMGMLATRIIADEIYNVSRLYHFTNKRFKGCLNNGKMAPDWVGFDAQGNAFLFESKGTYGEYINKSAINHAKKQLNNVSSIKDVSIGTMHCPQNGSKHIICSCFDTYAGIDKVWNIHDVDLLYPVSPAGPDHHKVWNIHDVDPEESGRFELEINVDKECFMYYQTFILYVDSLNRECQRESVRNQKYYCWIYEDEKYCILEEIYDLVKSERFNEQNMYYGFNNYVNEKLSDIEYPERFSHDGISSYKDGIVVCSAIF